MLLMGNACTCFEELFPWVSVVGVDAFLESVVVLKDKDCTGFSDQSTACCCFQS